MQNVFTGLLVVSDEIEGLIVGVSSLGDSHGQDAHLHEQFSQNPFCVDLLVEGGVAHLSGQRPAADQIVEKIVQGLTGYPVSRALRLSGTTRSWRSWGRASRT